MGRFVFHGVIVVLLTLLTQLGGVAWLIASAARRRLAVFVLAYGALWVGAMGVAPLMGRVALPCVSDGSTRMQSVLYCALNRHYVTPELASVVEDVSQRMAAEFEGTQTLVLDANFPFFAGFPLLPHLSHDDGEKVDLAFYYADEGGYLRGVTRSPIGYFAFEQGPSDCPARALTLRWDMWWVQPLWPAHGLETGRMAAVLRHLAEDARVDKVFIEPHLKQRLGVDSPKIRFQGCRAARHDDHIHLQL